MQFFDTFGPKFGEYVQHGYFQNASETPLTAPRIKYLLKTSHSSGALTSPQELKPQTPDLMKTSLPPLEEDILPTSNAGEFLLPTGVLLHQPWTPSPPKSSLKHPHEISSQQGGPAKKSKPQNHSLRQKLLVQNEHRNSITDPQSTSDEHNPQSSKQGSKRPRSSKTSRKTSHILVERHYRSRLNIQFSTLLNAIPQELIAAKVIGSSNGHEAVHDKRVSKCEIMELAKMHIQTLEKAGKELEVDNNRVD